MDGPSLLSAYTPWLKLGVLKPLLWLFKYIGDAAAVQTPVRPKIMGIVRPDVVQDHACSAQPAVRVRFGKSRHVWSRFGKLHFEAGRINLRRNVWSWISNTKMAATQGWRRSDETCWKKRPPFAAASDFRRAPKCLAGRSHANRKGAKIELWNRSVFIKSNRVGAIAFDVDQNPWFHGGGAW